MLESKIEKKLVSLVRRLGGECLKFVSPGNAGVPDRIVMMPHGEIHFIELKAPGEKPRALQMAVHDRFKRLGFPVTVIDSMKGVEAFVGALEEGQHGI